ncbi:hypothetical protein [Sphingomonas sp. GV3]|uniref:hypothetical protein n=1 Tax=Sphingomonas sp. GV3 TaxID=3040671 RepID=UPI00280B60A0|nr:hypothetical protein [Sphingomonas sp. GV3]
MRTHSGAGLMEAAQAAGQLIGGVGAYEAGKYNKAVAETEAVEAQNVGAADELRVREAARAAIGQQVAAQGSNGFAMGTGSAIDALQQSQINAALDAMQVRQEAKSRARALRIQGAIAKSQGDNALVQSMFGAASSTYRMQQDWASARRGSTPRPTSSGGSEGGGNALYEGP